MKNVLFIIVDQMRFDCLGANGNEQISTPNLNMLANLGVNFENCYSAVPTCIAARAAIMTGLSQEHHGRVGYQDKVAWTYPKTIASEFTKLGYQTQMVGKMHVYPERNRIGFENVILHDGYLHATRKDNNQYLSSYEHVDDYLKWYKQNSVYGNDLIDNGLDCNSWVVKPWSEPEQLHPTNWATMEAINFLERRDPINPFFLTVSYVRPHSPLDPPLAYYDMYKEVDIKYDVATWAKAEVVNRVDAVKGKLNERDLKRMRSAYYASISHIDNQIGRLLQRLQETGEAQNTLIVFTSDHGDQMGEHHLLRKAYPYQGSVHVPLIVFNPGDTRLSNVDTKRLVELRDLFPTMVELAAGTRVTDIDGLSLVGKKIHDYIHGEHLFGNDSNQYIVTKHWKLVWHVIRDEYQLFKLDEDPTELGDCKEQHPETFNKLKQLLVGELRIREEGFVVGNELVTPNNLVATLNVNNKA